MIYIQSPFQDEIRVDCSVCNPSTHYLKISRNKYFQKDYEITSETEAFIFQFESKLSSNLISRINQVLSSLKTFYSDDIEDHIHDIYEITLTYDQLHELYSRLIEISQKHKILSTIDILHIESAKPREYSLFLYPSNNKDDNDRTALYYHNRNSRLILSSHMTDLDSNNLRTQGDEKYKVHWFNFGWYIAKSWDLSLKEFLRYCNRYIFKKTVSHFDSYGTTLTKDEVKSFLKAIKSILITHSNQHI